MLVFVVGCQSSFDDCMDTCLELEKGYGIDCGFGICMKDYSDINETIKKGCFNECKNT